ncbi:TFIIH subunit Tfb4/p34 [Suillus paluster]|uniref:TFIIH subunit Tfb4/p34 n=1 Tax=Suillus paluster TaxID=48578 RepID=UPI001B86938C|nr:TFIIH subunit Tfb4/p34 [Suillus paluster]KAG1734670.1 TFIIH subunit Tfb4/p34 [Suillus paluster]
MEKASHLSVIVDLSPTQWHLSAQASNQYPLSIETFLSQLLAFLNAHIASKHENSLVVFGALPGKSVMLYSSTELLTDDVPSLDANSYLPFKLVDSTVVQRIMNEFDAIGKLEEEPPCALVGAVTKALCYINRIIHPSSATTGVAEDPSIVHDPRILILSVSPDLSSSYIPIMNAIFSAQKLACHSLQQYIKVTIDVCKVYGPDTVFLQQAAHLTNGSYIYLERRDALLQYLLMSFLSPPSIRKILAVPKQDKIDFRAACFCHKNIVDIGFVCSVCLSSAHFHYCSVACDFAVFCQPLPVCSTCRLVILVRRLPTLT